MGKREKKRVKVRRARVEKRRGGQSSTKNANKLGRRQSTAGGGTLLPSPSSGRGGGEEHNEPSTEGTRVPYSGTQRLLVLGDGDFSFAAGLVKRLGNKGSNVSATSFDAHQDVIGKYGKKAETCLAQLKKAGAVVAHAVDATKLDATLPTPVAAFDAIIFNFPHTGTQKVHLNRQLLRGFFASAQRFLSPSGTVHVTIKTAPPYSSWDVPSQAAEEGMKLMKKVPFRFQDFPGYQHRTTERDAVKFDAFEKRCVTFVFAPSNVSGRSSDPQATSHPVPSVDEQEPDTVPSAARALKTPRNKKLRMVMERKARLEAALLKERAECADMQGDATPSLRGDKSGGGAPSERGSIAGDTMRGGRGNAGVGVADSGGKGGGKGRGEKGGGTVRRRRADDAVGRVGRKGKKRLGSALGVTKGVRKLKKQSREEAI